MRKLLAWLLVFCLMNLPLLEAATAPGTPQDLLQQVDYPFTPFSPEQLDNLLAPVALYPDPLLSQVLLASMFVEDIDEAARWVRANGSRGIDDQPWDASVRAVAHYPTVIAMMADRIDWTASLGQAYAYQSTDVMISVQRLRRMAYNAGNLFTTPQQQILIEDDFIRIVPYEPALLYVPVYDPYICYYRRPLWGAAITFSIGFLIGVWLNRDCDWHHHRIYYHGWRGPGWVQRSRPRVHITNVYVNSRFETEVVNRRILQRPININNINRYHYIHWDVNYDNIRINNERALRRRNLPRAEQPPRTPVNNRVMNRNIDTTNPRLDQYRGRERAERPTQPPPAPPAVRPAPPPRPEPHVFGRREGNFDPRASSQRGQSSRKEMEKPRPAPRTGPPPGQQKKPAAAPQKGRRKP